MGITWAVVWAPFGLLAGFIVDRTGAMDEPWILVGALPGFFCGVVFSVVLAITERRGNVDELSPARVALWGAAGGLAMMLLTSTLGTPNEEHLFWRARFLVMGGVTLLSAASAAGSLLLARKAKKREVSQRA
jgi:peptidoglycan/LPS O-acetylase OafA/YrhL